MNKFCQGCQLLRSKPRLESQDQYGRAERRGRAWPGWQDSDIHVYPHWNYGQEVKLAHPLHWGLPQTKGLFEGHRGSSSNFEWTLNIDDRKISILAQILKSSDFVCSAQVEMLMYSFWGIYLYKFEYHKIKLDIPCTIFNTVVTSKLFLNFTIPHLTLKPHTKALSTGRW